MEVFETLILEWDTGDAGNLHSYSRYEAASFLDTGRGRGSGCYLCLPNIVVWQSLNAACGKFRESRRNDRRGEPTCVRGVGLT
jgi:hypothetical protein